MSRHNGPNIVTNGLVLYLDAANRQSYPGSGTSWYDVSENGNSGTLTNGPTFDSGNGGSIVFDRVDDYINVPPFSLGKIFTVEMFLKPSTTSYGQCFLGKHSNAGDNYFILGYWNGYHVRITSQYTESITLSTEWQHLILTVNTLTSNTNITLYKNTDLLYNHTFTVTLPDGWDTGGKDFAIGQDWDSSTLTSDFFGGNMSIVRLYNRILSAAEILQNYNATKARYGL